MTAIGKIVLMIMLLLLVVNFFLLFEIHKISGSLANARAAINQLDKKTSQNQNDINSLKDGLFHIYAGGG